MFTYAGLLLLAHSTMSLYLYNAETRLVCQYKVIFLTNMTLMNVSYIYTPGFHEKGSLSYLCAIGIDRQSPLNECTLQETFI